MKVRYQHLTVCNIARSGTVLHRVTIYTLNNKSQTTFGKQQQQQPPFNGLWSGTTRVGQYQKKQLLWIFMEQVRIMEAEAPTVRVGATPTGLMAPHPHNPSKVFYRPDALPAAQPTASKH